MGWVRLFHALLRNSAAAGIFPGPGPASADVKWVASFDVSGTAKPWDYLLLRSLMEESRLGRPVMCARPRNHVVTPRSQPFGARGLRRIALWTSEI